MTAASDDGLHDRLRRAARLADAGSLEQAQAALDDAPSSARTSPLFMAVQASVAARSVSEPRRLREAARLYKRLKKTPHWTAQFANDYGNVLKLLGDLDGAGAEIRDAATLRPDLPGVFGNLAAVHYEAGDWGPAERYAREALRRDPKDARARRALGHLMLGAARFEEGWRAYEARFDLPGKPSAPAPLRDLPRWAGEPLGDRRLACWSEQGVGEHVLFGSLVAELAAAHPGQVAYVVDPRMQALFARSVPEAMVFASDALDGLAADLQAPIGATGPALRPDEASFRDHGPYLKADPERRAQMRDWLRTLGPGRRIGLSWRSSKTRAADKKSIPLETWGPVLKRPDMVFVNLQYGETDAEIRAAKSKTGALVASHPELDRTDDIDGLTALISELDLVVTTSNVTAHLAGAAGLGGLVLLPTAPFWFWGYRGEERSLWHPSLELVRRTSPASWGPSLRAAAAWLDARRGGAENARL
ncbi:MAG: tetratricopeptide repeat protein [Pseudomonadota bacterium]